MTRASKAPAPRCRSVNHSASARRRYDVRDPSGGALCQARSASVEGHQHLQEALRGDVLFAVRVAALE